MNVRRIAVIAILALVLAAVAHAGQPAGGVVNINEATASQLELLPRIGPALAQRILEFRKANGPFKSLDELVAVKGIGERSLERLRPYLTLTGPTTLSEKVHLRRANRDGTDGH